MNGALLQILGARAFHDLAAAQSALLVALGDRLGFYEALRSRRLSAQELASLTHCDPRLVAEWLAHQAASTYVSVDGDRYFLSEEQAAVFSGSGPSSLAGGFAIASSLASALPQIEEAFHSGRVQMPPSVGESIARASSSRYRETLVSLLPENVVSALARGCDVVEIGCGSAETLANLAAKFEASRFTGYEPDARRSTLAPRSGRVKIVNASATLMSEPADLVLSIESLHEMGDVDAVCRAVAACLRTGGVWIAIEPALSEGDADVTTRYLRSLSALHCLTAAPGALGASATEAEYEACFRRNGLVSRRIGRAGSTTIWEVGRDAA